MTADFMSRLAEQRRKFLDGLDANQGDINLDIFEDFYPDQAHFVFELLQNAEDTKATEAKFILKEDGCIFEHNGKRAFTEEDVRAITGIHNSTKSKSVDQIGKFGVGFKSVFVYSLTPEIVSGDFAFRITRLVMPEPIECPNINKSITRIWLPFNNPKKDAALAFEEVARGLEGLSETSLLFLSHLESIDWEIAHRASGQILRLRHSEHHIEILRQESSGPTTSVHLLRFEEAVEGLSKQNVAVAYPLRFLGEQTEFDKGKPLAKQMRIVPADIGQVAVFFPAEKETSGLRYHLHAPFVPELSRASVKETSANTPLFDQLARLSASSLYAMRDLDLLNAEALAILPNKQDSIPKRYQPIRQAVIAELNDNELTPTQDRKHAPAKHLLQSKASIKEVLSSEDLKLLTDFADFAPRWAASAPQKNSNADRMLSSLAIREWEFDDLVSAINERAGPYCWNPSIRAQFQKWLASKSDEWFQQFYSLLHRELAQEYYGAGRLSDAHIVKLRDGTFAAAKGSYFPSDIGDDEGFPRVDPAVYTSGKSKAHQSAARKFLEEAGVDEVGETEQVEAILKERYSRDCDCPDEKTHLKDLRRFIALVEKDPAAARIFQSYYVFECGDGEWRTPSGVYLDLPFCETGLGAFYGALADAADLFPLAPKYHDSISTKRIANFAKAVGAQVEFSPSKRSTLGHPESSKLRADYYQYGTRWTSTAIDEDWEIDGLEDALEAPSESLSRLVWKSMCAAPPKCLEARFRPNQQYNTKRAPSSLVLVLRDAEWIPQTGGSFVKPSQASRDLLPPGFPFDPGQQWLKAVRFGEETAILIEKERQKEALAKEFGFKDKTALEDAKKFAEVDPEERRRILDELDRRASFVLPEQHPSNPERRATKVAEQAGEAPGKESEERTRSVQVGLVDVKAEAEQYLRRQYTNPDGETICQICKAPLPFKLDDGRYYLEKVEFIRDIEKRHFQNYLALCPNHAAMYQHVHGSADLIRDLLIDGDGDRIDIILAGRDETIYFTEVHLLDLKAILAASPDEHDQEVA